MQQPDFVAYDEKQREEFLSQLGTFSPAERELFHALCGAWQERIPYNRFVASPKVAAASGELSALLNKLRRERVGLLRTKINDAQRVPEYIVLSQQDGLVFYRELIDEFFMGLLESIVNPLPLQSVITADFGAVPPRHMDTIDPLQLAPYFEEQETSKQILRLTTFDNDALLVTQSNLRVFVNVAITKMRYYFSNTTLLGIVAKLKDTSVIALKQSIAGKEPAVWLDITRTVVERRAELSATRSITLDKSFFHCAVLLKSLIESQLQHAEQKKRAREERDVDLEAIALAIKESPEGWVDQVQLSRLIDALGDKYGDQLESFREEFYQKYVKHRDGPALPRIVQLQQFYVNRDVIFALFNEHFKMMTADVRLYLAQQMNDMLSTNNRSGNTTFFSADNLDEAIRTYVNSADQFLGALIQKPQFLAEALIWHLKQHKLVKDVEELKERLALYFDPQTMKPLRLSIWFNINMVDLFEDAFSNLPILKRIWIRLTGKYDAFRAGFLGRTNSAPSTATPRRSDEDTGGAAGERGARNGGGNGARGGQTTRPVQRGSARGTSNRGGGSGTGAAAAARTPRPAPKPAYSRRQQDTAWDSFKQTIKKD